MGTAPPCALSSCDISRARHAARRRQCRLVRTLNNEHGTCMTWKSSISLQILSLLLLLAAPPPAHAAPSLPVDYFTRSDELGTMKISPDGTFVAMTSGQHGGQFLTFVDLASRKIAGGLKAPEGLEIGDFH